MDYALNKFRGKIEFIKKQLHSQGLANELRSFLLEKELGVEEEARLKGILDNKTDEKIYQYTANIISLYGGLESFVETIAEEYLKSLSALFPSYEKLKRATGISDYMSQGVSLLSHAEERKLKELPKKDVLKGLYKAVVNDDSTALQSEAFIDVGGGNYKHSTIMKCFSRMGVSEMQDKLKNYEPLSCYIVENSLDTSSNFYTKIDDLVERRNELSHGSENLELLDAEPFAEYLAFLSIYTETINNYLNNKLKHYGWGLLDGEVIEPRVYSNNVIMLKAENAAVGTRFAKGQKIMLLRDGKYYDGKIENIHVGDVDYERYEKREAGMEIGLMIDSACKITKECKIKVFKLESCN